MKTIQFQAPAREEINASMVHNKSVSHLDLSLGISSSNDPAHHYKNAPTTVVSKRSRMVSFQPEEHIEASPAYKKTSTVSLSSRSAFDYSYLFSHCPTGFVDPWSLAARQQKAAVEQAHLKPNPNYSSSNITNAETAPVAVGWPPICSSRRNLISQNSSSSKFSTMYVEKADSSLKSETKLDGGAIIRLELRPTMYVKVNMEGFSVGRKIDLSAHHSYDSLSRTLQNMFYNFLSNKLITKDSNVDDSEFILLYEDHEGDKILVGDVPWELFLTSVKRLYIARHSSAQEKASEDTKEKDTSKEEATLLN